MTQPDLREHEKALLARCAELLKTRRQGEMRRLDVPKIIRQ
jgi:hypothetical protein